MTLPEKKWVKAWSLENRMSAILSTSVIRCGDPQDSLRKKEEKRVYTKTDKITAKTPAPTCPRAAFVSSLRIWCEPDTEPVREC